MENLNSSPFCEVILPLPLPNRFTYKIPDVFKSQIEIGKRVVVPFHTDKLQTGIVVDFSDKANERFEIREIEDVLDEIPVVNAFQFKLWKWMSDYYLCNEGDVMNAALPGNLKLSSETKIVFSAHENPDIPSLNDKEYLLYQALEGYNALSLKDISSIIGRKVIMPTVKSLIEKGYASYYEELNKDYKPKTEKYVLLDAKFENQEFLNELFLELEKKWPKQLELLIKFIDLSKHFSPAPLPVKKRILLKEEISNSAFQSLVKKNIFIEMEREEGRIPKFAGKTSSISELQDFQQTAYQQIKDNFDAKKIVLLHGVTGSGKTEVYIQLIADAIQKNKQVLYLLPEIALTTQIITRLQKVFGQKVVVYHSRFSDNERIEIIKSLHSGKSEFKIILAARSGIFLPFSNLGLIIIDEEHDHSFKQYDPAPRYHARDTAIWLAAQFKANVLLGSATPSLESYHNAKTGKFALVELKQRFGGIQMPEIKVADMRVEWKSKKDRPIVSAPLHEEITTALKQKEQIILFQNRRGYNPYLQCNDCGHVVRCVRCDVSLTFHKAGEELRCHYCGYKEKYPGACVSCGSLDLQNTGFGTEKVEENLRELYPEAKIARLDLDTTRTKNSFQRIFAEFEERNIDILVGTQMVTKGLDFDNVALVGILNADQMLQHPDFRAYERSFQLMAQVAGRAGRKKKQGRVIIQSIDPKNPVIQYVIDNDFIGFFDNQQLEREAFLYPPFYRLILFTIQHRDRKTVIDASAFFAQLLIQNFGTRVLGPEFPPVSWIKNIYRKSIMLKLEKKVNLTECKKMIRESIKQVQLQDNFKSVRIIADVDPY